MKAPNEDARDGRVGVVIATRDRLDALLVTLENLTRLPERPRVVVVDNASTEPVAASVARGYPEVELVALARNAGAAARTVGVRRLPTRYVAFSDNDSWWEAGALTRAGDLFDAHPRLALVQGRVLVGDERRLDPVCAEMANSPLRPRRDLPGRAVLGFVACGAVVRRSAFLSVGGFDPRARVGGEEELVAIDLAAAGWDLAYVEGVVAYHYPSGQRDRGSRRRALVANELRTAWLRRPARRALGATLTAIAAAARDHDAARGLLEVVRGWPWVAANRRTVTSDLEARLRALEKRG